MIRFMVMRENVRTTRCVLHADTTAQISEAAVVEVHELKHGIHGQRRAVERVDAEERHFLVQVWVGLLGHRGGVVRRRLDRLGVGTQQREREDAPDQRLRLRVHNQTHALALNEECEVGRELKFGD